MTSEPPGLTHRPSDMGGPVGREWTWGPLRDEDFSRGDEDFSYDGGRGVTPNLYFTQSDQFVKRFKMQRRKKPKVKKLNVMKVKNSTLSSKQKQKVFPRNSSLMLQHLLLIIDDPSEKNSIFLDSSFGNH